MRHSEFPALSIHVRPSLRASILRRICAAAPIVALVLAACASDDGPTTPQNPGPPAAARYGGSGDDRAITVARTPSGGFIWGAQFQDTLRVGGSQLIATGVGEAGLVAHGADGSVLWSTQSSSSAGGAAVASDVAVFDNGEFVMGGVFSGTTAFDGLSVTGVNDILLASFSASGQANWVVRAGGTGTDFASAVTIDDAGNIIVVGIFEGTAFFGGGVSITSAGNFDVFVAKYSSTGSIQWARAIGGTMDDIGRGVAADGAGNIYVAGAFTGTVNFGFGNVTASGPSDGFVLSLSSGGAPQWVLPIGNTLNDACADVAAAPNGDVVVSGSFMGTFTLGGVVVPTRGSGDGFVSRLTSAGNHKWSLTMGGTENDGAERLSVSSSQTIVSGTFRSTFSLPGDVNPRFSSAGETDGFLVAINNTGGALYAGRFGGTMFDDPGDVAIVAAGVVWVGGFEGTAEFGSQSLTSAGDYDIFRWIR